MSISKDEIEQAGNHLRILSGNIVHKGANMPNLEEALKKNNLTMPNPPKPGGIYTPVRQFGASMCYTSGCTPSFNGERPFIGKVGKEITLEQGQEAAKLCILNIMANLQNSVGLGRVKRIVKMIAFVAAADGFYEHPKVANGGSQLLVDIFGEEIGLCARSAIGVYSLPGNVPVEIELLVELTS